MDEAAPTREWGSLVDVLISVDMKGVAGIATRQQTNPGGRDYPIARALMTAEANAAVAGAFDGGATSVVVNDSHGPMDNLLGEQLDPRADYVKAFPGVVTVPVKTALGRPAARSQHPVAARPPSPPPRGPRPPNRPPHPGRSSRYPSPANWLSRSSCGSTAPRRWPPGYLAPSGPARPRCATKPPAPARRWTCLSSGPR